MTTKKQQTFQADNLPSPAISQAADSGKTGFLDLSAEIRNEIYQLALVSPHDIQIGQRVAKDGSLHFYTVAPSSAIDPQEQTSGKAVNILATCRQIKEEATPILYGANTFIVRWEHCLNQFTDNTLPLVRKLKVCSLGWTRRKDIDSFFVKLRLCILQQRLPLIKLELAYKWGMRPTHYFAERLTPTMRAVIKGGKRVDEAISMVELFVENGFGDKHKAKMEGKAALYTSKLKGKLGKILRK